MRITSAILLLSAAGLGFTACSSDDDNTPATGPANQVSFNVTVPRAQRAATTTGTISQFYAWTFVDGKEYMPGVSVSRLGGAARHLLAGRRPAGQFLLRQPYGRRRHTEQSLGARHQGICKYRRHHRPALCGDARSYNQSRPYQFPSRTVTPGIQFQAQSSSRPPMPSSRRTRPSSSPTAI